MTSNNQTIKFLIITNHNSDGLINCLRQPGQLQSQPLKSMREKFLPFIKFCSIYKILWHPDSFVYRDSIIGAVGRRSGALFFARHRDYFILTLNFTAVYLDLVPFRSFTVTRSLLPSTGTGKKQVTATQTAPN